MGTDYILTGDDQPGPDPSLAEDLLELQLLTAGKPTGPVDAAHGRDHHNF